jgi:hypothetical protein
MTKEQWAKTHIAQTCKYHYCPETNTSLMSGNCWTHLCPGTIGHIASIQKQLDTSLAYVLFQEQYTVLCCVSRVHAFRGPSRSGDYILYGCVQYLEHNYFVLRKILCMSSHEPIRKHQQVRPQLCFCSTKLSS